MVGVGSSSGQRVSETWLDVCALWPHKTTYTQEQFDKKAVFLGILVYLLYIITAVVEVSGGGGWGGLEVVDDPADGLDVGVLGLPLIMAAVLATLHDVHATAEVWLLVHHPTEDGEKKVGGSITGYYNDLFAFFIWIK